MNKLQQLKEIANNQKTISTSRLLPILKEIEKMYIETAEKVSYERKRAKKANEQFNRLSKYKKADYIKDYEELTK
jgi:hypothetical protein